MPRCRFCNERLRADDAFCATCSRPVEREADRGSVATALDHAGSERAEIGTTIARCTSAAEAGYFAHELQRTAGIDADVEMTEDFEAAAGHWATRFALNVPADDAARAAEILREIVEREDAVAAGLEHEAVSVPSATNEAEFDVDGHATAWTGSEFEPDSEGGLPWVPIVLTLTAGSVVFWMIRAWDDARQPRAAAAPIDPPHRDLWDRLSSPEPPWREPHENGQGIRELRIDARRRTAIIREDADGDGHFERELRVENLMQP